MKGYISREQAYARVYYIVLKDLRILRSEGEEHIKVMMMFFCPEYGTASI